MSSPITALVTIRFSWIKTAGLERLLMHLAENRNPQLTGTLVLPATGYDTSDSVFIAIAFSNPGLELEGTVLVPKAEVITIVKTEDPQDMAKVGYTARAHNLRIEQKSSEETVATSQ